MKIYYHNCPEKIEVEWLDYFDVVIYNYHPGINDAIAKAPYRCKAKQVGIFHEGDFEKKFDLWLFSDPTQLDTKQIKYIGRPLPEWEPTPRDYDKSKPFTVGLNGFCGAWAQSMVAGLLRWETNFKLRLALPPSDHCDPLGHRARSTVLACLSMLPNSVEVDACHDFMSEADLLTWLSGNDLNCYVRSPEPSVGVSSALDLAMAVRRPIAINRHNMFRHLWGCQPTIILEESSVRSIIHNGLMPLVPAYARNSREMVRTEVETIFEALG
jgi:hypothetical protein